MTDGVDHFVISAIGSQVVGVPFAITITAVDGSNNTVTTYVDTNQLSSSVGKITPTITSAFISGIWTGLVTLDTATGSMVLLAVGRLDGKSGLSAPFVVTAAPIPGLIYLGDTLLVQATITDAVGAPVVPDSQLVIFYDGNGREVGRYTNPTATDTNVFTQAHLSKEFDAAGSWKCHWQITKSGIVDSEEFIVGVFE